MTCQSVLMPPEKTWKSLRNFMNRQKNIQKALGFREIVLKTLFHGHLAWERHRIQPFTFITVLIKKANLTLSMTWFRLNQCSKIEALCLFFGGFGVSGRSEELIKRQFFLKPHSILCSLETESRKRHWQLQLPKHMHTQPACTPQAQNPLCAPRADFLQREACAGVHLWLRQVPDV